MTYIMDFKVAGRYRTDDEWGPIGAASAVQIMRTGATRNLVELLPAYPRPTKRRAELTAILIALETAWSMVPDLRPSTRIDLIVRSDSPFAINCMNAKIHRWASQGWIDGSGNDVANADLLREALYLHERLVQYGAVDYVLIRRAPNRTAVRLCNHAMRQ